MENYEEFIQRQTIQTRCKANGKSEPTTSLHLSTIRFYGLPILPPLLNEEQKVELRRLRETASSVRNTRRTSSQSRVSHIQAILESVQLRKVPTFDEFNGETKLTSPLNTGSHSIDSFYGDKDKHEETTENHWNSSSPCILPSAYQMYDEKVPVTASCPLTSTACDGHARSSLIHFQREDSLEDSHSTVLFEGVPLLGHRLEREVESNTAYGFDSVLSHSDKHPHIDVSHQSLSSGYVTNETSGVNSTWVEGTGNTRIGTESRHTDVGEIILSASTLTHKTGDIISHAPVDGDVLEEEYETSNQACNDVTEPVNPPAEPDPGEGPYQMSLQNLLKKSQEHRRRQRLLRNQAKSVKADESGRAGEHSLSDKENEGILSRRTDKTDVRRTRVMSLGQEKDDLPHRDGQRESVEPCEIVSHVKHTEATTCDVSRDITSASKSLRSTTGKAMSALSNTPHAAGSPARSTSAAVPTSAKSLYQSKGKKTGSMLPRPCLTGNKKFKNIPTPKFSLSPVRSKKGSTISSPVRKPLVKTSVGVNDEAGPTPSKQTQCKTKEGAPLDQTEQIAQLELNLSSLKVLISDLESTLAESQTHPANPTEAARSSPPEQHESVSLPAGDGMSPRVVPFSETVRQEELSKRYAIRPGNKQRQPTHLVTSVVQKKRVPEAFRAINSTKQFCERTSVFTDVNSQLLERKDASGEKKKGSEKVEDSLNGSSLNRSYDVDTPSGLWSQTGSGGKQLTPELGGQEGTSRAKRRLVMNTADRTMSEQQRGEDRTPISKEAIQRPAQEEHEAQVRALVEEQLRQQQELLQSLAMKYQFLRSVSFPCPGAGSRLEDMATSSLCPSSVSVGLDDSSHLPELTLAELSVLSDSLNISQSRASVPVCHRPLVAAAVKGYLTRRLLRTDRVSQLVRTIKDTQLFLQGFQPPTPGREYSSRQDRALQERVSLQLRSARYELHDLFFSVCPTERMQVISWDRQLARERELRRKEHKEPEGRGKSSLSAATRKALERKRTMMLQKKAAEKTKLAVGAEEGWTFVPNPRRVPKKTTPLRRR